MTCAELSDALERIALTGSLDGVPPATAATLLRTAMIAGHQTDPAGFTLTARGDEWRLGLRDDPGMRRVLQKYADLFDQLLRVGRRGGPRPVR